AGCAGLPGRRAPRSRWQWGCWWAERSSAHLRLVEDPTSRGGEGDRREHHDHHEEDPCDRGAVPHVVEDEGLVEQDRKSTRLNSSHVSISYAVFCLKKKTEKNSKDDHSSAKE